MKQQLTKIHIKGYKSLKDVDTEIMIEDPYIRQKYPNY